MEFVEILPHRAKVCLWTSYCLVMLLGLYVAHNFYLFGATDFVTGDPLQVKVQILASVKTQLSYSYYSLPYCMPKEIVDHVSLGEILQKDLIEDSPYEFKMLELQKCRVVCRTTLNDKDAKVLKEAIDGEYRVNMILDDLPLVMLYNRSDMNSLVYQQGFPVGVKMLYAATGKKMEHKYFINNHLTFIVKYHKDENSNDAIIVGFEVKPFSVKHEYEGKWNDKIRLTNCDPNAKYNVTGKDSPLEVEDEKEIIFTYDVEFQESEIRWVSRWETCVCSADSHIHWFSVLHSITMFMLLFIAMDSNVLPMIDNDISPNTKMETQEEDAEVTEEETGWPIVRGDVFRPPKNSDLLCVFAGTGVQCFGMILVTMISAAFGFITPSTREELMKNLLCGWVFMGIFAGYTSTTILLKIFNGTQWKKMTIKTSFLGMVIIIFFILSGASWGEESWGAVPFGTLFASVIIFVSLVYVGSYVGFSKHAAISGISVLKINRIPREIPKQPWFMHPVFTILIGGIFPFGVVSVELFFIVTTSVWMNKFYCIAGFLFPVFLSLILICAQMSMILCYYQLCKQDYLWWWRSFLTSGSSALYLFLYVAYIYFTKTKPVSAIVYFGCAIFGSFAFFVLTGTIGLFACLLLTTNVYTSLKVQDGSI